MGGRQTAIGISDKGHRLQMLLRITVSVINREASGRRKMASQVVRNVRRVGKGYLTRPREKTPADFGGLVVSLIHLKLV